MQLSNKKLQLIQDNSRLKARVRQLQEEESSDTSHILFPDFLLGEEDKQLKALQIQYIKEKEKADMLQRELNENYRRISMLNNGSQQLDNILAIGRTKSICSGLGY